ncbi:hypothetical protein BU16DRAFT_529329 [Lophium mytilinum]|uniref:histidine kinase n=1 Tax=Lophium mytilinum TaxID=390894 RepID=A0A6A6QJR7_9PEZI|nr:hypothetical protein BU16DRAFT_529329 [Lophium mytilinum]
MPKQLSETAREREFYKYAERYVADAESESHLLSPRYSPPQTSGSFPWITGSVAASSHDTSLTAFAQLGALRLNAKRCIISLFNRTQQFVIAEATQTLSLQSDLVHDAGDALWLGTTVLPRESGICQLVVDMPSNAPCPDDPHSLGVIVVPDLAKDERFAELPFVVNKPFTRFYAGVPICSPRGAHIGSYCVMDDVPREGIGKEHAQFMKDMAITIMAHLELARSREEHRRGERLVRGLGSFVEGKSTLRNWRGGATVADRTYEPSRVDFGGEGQLNVQQQDLQKAQDEIVISLDRSSTHRGSVSTDVANHQSISTHSTSRSTSEPLLPDQAPSPYLTPASTPPRSPEPTLRGSSGHSTATGRQPSMDLQASMLSLNVKQTFSRAANIIRESMEIEGAIFLDASIGSFGGMVSDASSASDETSDSLPSSSGGESDKTVEEKMSGILGFSTSNKSSINGDFTSKNALPIPETFLKGLLRRHPKGKIYYFDEEGRISSSDSSGEDSSKRVGRRGFDSTNRSSDGSSAKRKKAHKRFSKFNEAETLIKTFPGARCIALIPLWDNHRERWFSGGIVWTNTPKRVFTAEGELSYLSAFSSIIMAEVARLDASMSDKAKTDLLGSISHELRSPLHGILGSVEMLEDSAVTAFQGNMVQTIETCGRTLLDTIDHLLDFTKINHFMEVSKRHRTHVSHNNTESAPRSKTGSDMMAMSARVQLDVITEEVVAAVSAGYDTQKRAKANANSSQQKKKPKMRHADSSASGAHDASYSSDRYGDAQINNELKEYNLGGVIVILDIDKDVDWAFSTQAGAWRRIVMNLFANSLKYTARGYIRVSLKARPLPSRRGVSRSKITLIVSDSGKGMSKDYLRGRLFQPFAQEDRLSPGTGLGLSIIRQIILSQGGKIDVQSVQDEGTQVTVTLPLAQAEPEINGSTQIDDTCLTDVYEQTKTLSACLIGVEIGAEANKARKPSVPFDAVNDGPQALKLSLQEMCKDWFGLRLETKHQTGHPSDLYLVVETPFNTEELTSGKLVAEIPRIDQDQSDQLQPIVIVLCRSAASAYALSSRSQHIDSKGRVVEYLSQPCGPRKLAKALHLCFERRTSDKKSVISSPTCTTLLGAPPLEDDVINQFGFPSVSSIATDATGYYDTDSPVSPGAVPVSLAVLHPHLLSPLDPSTSDGPIASIPQNLEDKADKVPGPFMIVDDNHINVKILAAFMKKSKYLYRVAEDGAIAFDLFKANPEACRIIFMDISMPVMDGLTSTRLIRAYERMNKLNPATIILLTGLASASVQQEANASGADLFLTKPVRLKDLGKILLEMGK